MKDLLLLGRPDEPAGFASINLAELAHAAAQAAESESADRAGRVQIRADGPVSSVQGDAGRLTQVLVNLLQNALSLSPEGAPVEVNLSMEGDMAQIRVRDRGPGIAQEFLPRLFQPFQSQRKGGTGLGLAIVQKIVADHGGVITATNNDPGPGANFTLRLPVEEGRE
jgi:signal transduction histidine kinase